MLNRGVRIGCAAGPPPSSLLLLLSSLLLLPVLPLLLSFIPSSSLLDGLATKGRGKGESYVARAVPFKGPLNLHKHTMCVRPAPTYAEGQQVGMEALLWPAQAAIK